MRIGNAGDTRGRAMTIAGTLIVIMLLSTTVAASVIRVPNDAATIQEGVNLAQSGDTVLVAPGTYTGVGNRDIDFSDKSLVVRSETGAAETIIDCDASAQDRHRAFYVHYGQDATCVIDGFTIRNGVALLQPIIENSEVMWYEGGGAIMCQNASPLITNCRFEDNWSGTAQQSDLQVGGAIACYRADPVIRGNEFLRNGAYLAAGAISCHRSSPQIEDNFFQENFAGGFGQPYGYGGALACVESHADLTGNVMVDNVSVFGGAIYTAGPISITSCTMVRNSADSCGGAICCSDSGFTLCSSIIAFSRKGEAAGVEDATGSWPEPILSCNNIFGNAGGDWVGAIMEPNGLSEDPMFCDIENYNYRLDVNSPCAPANNEWGVLMGARDVGCSPTAVDDPGSEDRLPNGFTLAQNFPNPFNPMTYIGYSLATRAEVSVEIYNVLGQRVRTLIDGVQPPGEYSLAWDGTDQSGRPAPTGVYFYRLKVGDFSQTRKMVLLK